MVRTYCSRAFSYATPFEKYDWSCDEIELSFKIYSAQGDVRVLLTNSITWRLCFRAFQFNEVIPLLLGSELFIRRKGLCWRGSLGATGHRGSCTDGLIPAFSAPLTDLVPNFIQCNQQKAASHAPPPPSSLIFCIPQFLPTFNTFLCKPPSPILVYFLLYSPSRLSSTFNLCFQIPPLFPFPPRFLALRPISVLNQTRSSQNIFKNPAATVEKQQHSLKVVRFASRKSV